jgi:hypothetical protein
LRRLQFRRCACASVDTNNVRSACHAALFAHAWRRSLSTIIMHSHALQLDVTRNLVRGHGLRRHLANFRTVGKQGRHSWISTRLRRQWHGSSGRARRRLLRQRKRANRYPARRRIASHRRRLRQHKSPKPPRRSPMRPRNRLWTVVLSASQGSSPPELSCSRGAGVALVFVLRVNLQMTHARAHTHTLVRAHAQTHTPQTQTQTQANKTLTHTRQACVPLRVHWLVAEIGRDLSLLPRQREGL